jgi:hypothetical protein
MSYRAFKRLLGETSLERKCRFLFGAGILVLITVSFWFYAYKTEDLAYGQATITCRLLAAEIVRNRHMEKNVLSTTSSTRTRPTWSRTSVSCSRISRGPIPRRSRRAGGVTRTRCSCITRRSGRARRVCSVIRRPPSRRCR